MPFTPEACRLPGVLEIFDLFHHSASGSACISRLEAQPFQQSATGIVMDIARDTTTSINGYGSLLPDYRLFAEAKLPNDGLR